MHILFCIFCICILRHVQYVQDRPLHIILLTDLRIYYDISWCNIICTGNLNAFQVSSSRVRFQVTIWNLGKTRYRYMMSRYRYFPILNPISGTILQTPDIWTCPDIGHTRYRVSLEIGYTSYRDQYRDIPISGPNVTMSGHWVSLYRTQCFLFPAGPGPRAGAGFPAAAACS